MNIIEAVKSGLPLRRSGKLTWIHNGDANSLNERIEDVLQINLAESVFDGFTSQMSERLDKLRAAQESEGGCLN